MESPFHAVLIFFLGEVALCARPSTAPQAEGILAEGLALWLGGSLAAAAVSPASAAAEAGLSSLCARPLLAALVEGPFVDALGEGVGLLARDGKLSSSRAGAA